MNRSDRWAWHTGPKKPPPAHGIKMKKAGATWWGQRWIEALEGVLGGSAGRLARGRTYARAGRTHDLVIERGKVRAKVTGSRPEPYAVAIELVQISPAVWRKAIASMAAKAQFSAELLASRMPKDIDSVFREAGTSLFPRQRADLATSCSCPDWGDPCKHVAATHYVLGEAFDRDPFLLFELRGRTKDDVLEALREARASADSLPSKQRRTKKPGAFADPTSAQAPKVTLGRMKPADYDKSPASLPALHFSFDAPGSEGAVLRQLGAPPGWQAADSPAETLAPLIHAAAESARRIALGEPAPAAGDRGSDPVTQTRTKIREPKPKR